MQCFLNGFRTSDPAVAEAPHRVDGPVVLEPLPAMVDVLIVGSGPTGLTLAAQLAAFPTVTTRLIEQRHERLKIGQADGIACRTMEMFQAFGFSERVLREAYWVNETCFWRADEKDPQCLRRTGVIQDVETGLSEFPHVILSQARIHDFYLDLMRDAPAPMRPDYRRRLISYNVEASGAPDPRAYPVVVQIERALDAHRTRAEPAVQETVRARYLVGCDGARSTVRGLMGQSLQGRAGRQAWGVMDVLAITDFPDIRRKAVIHAAAGSMLIIPREGGFLVRLYIELERLKGSDRVSKLNVTTETLIAAARRILAPHTLIVKEVAWWSVYEIGQRLCSRFDDLRDSADVKQIPRVFIAGDSCHTHSPKAGQGMNVSMQDAFNLGWKLAAVVSGRAAPQVLSTYSIERHAVAQELIDFDFKLSGMFGARLINPGTGEGVDTKEFQEYFVRQGRFTAGTLTCYKPSLLTGDNQHQHLAPGFQIGTRFHSALVIRYADARSTHLGHRIRADGRWRLFAFADKLAFSVNAPLRKLCEFLECSPRSPVLRHTPADEDIDAVIELIAVLQQPHSDLSIEAVPAMLLPRKGRYQLVDYEKVYCASPEKGADIFDLRGIDRKVGALVVVRPDQHIAHVTDLADYECVARFFDGFMRDART